MPVPGSLKRRPVDEKELADLLERQFKIKTIETRSYLNLLEKNDMTLQELARVLDLPLDEAQALAERMISSGLIIRATGPNVMFDHLHPSMTIMNIIKVYEMEVDGALRNI